LRMVGIGWKMRNVVFGLDLLLTQRLVGWLGVSLLLLLSFHHISTVFSTSTKKTYCAAVAVRHLPALGASRWVSTY
jgi:hypothetical protein